MKVSVVIPALNERENLPRAVAAVRAALPGAAIVVVDGGSHDGTPDWVRRSAGVRLIVSPTRGRGPQMNAGAAAPPPECDVLVFLHADTLLPPDAGERIADALRDPGTAGGCFAVRFAETTPASLPLTAALINLQSRVRRAATGDQAIWVRRDRWEALGGFRAWPLFEDIEFVDRLKRRFGRCAFVVLPGAAVAISARRWQEFGVARTSLWMCLLWIGYKAGISPVRLKRLFTDVRPHLKR
jgi:rSAM/selenodomain-associated transferase 2